MGVGNSKNGASTKAKVPNAVAVKRVPPGGNGRSQSYTVLMQGSGESGKSTIVRQMEFLYGNVEVSRGMIPTRTVFLNTMLHYVVETIQKMEEKGQSITNTEHAKRIISHYEAQTEDNCHLTAEIADILLDLTQDRAFRYGVTTLGDPCAQNTLLAQLENCKDFPEWGGDNWEPTHRDLMLMRFRTTGSQVHREFVVNGNKLTVVDVGGQQGERAKFYRLFRQVDCIIFVASLSCYDLKLYEDTKVNRLDDSLNLFGKVTAMPDTENCHVIVFLNKVDVFRRKFVECKIPFPEIENCTPVPVLDDTNAETEEESYNQAIQWFKDNYFRRASDARRQTMSRQNFLLTNALDSTLMEDVLNRIHWEEVRQATRIFMGFDE